MLEGNLMDECCERDGRPGVWELWGMAWMLCSWISCSYWVWLV